MIFELDYADGVLSERTEFSKQCTFVLCYKLWMWKNQWHLDKRGREITSILGSRVLTFNHHTSGAPVQMNLVQSGAQTNCDVTNIQQHSAVIVFKQFLGYLPSYSGHSTISWLELHNTNTGHIKPVSYSGIISNYLDQLVSKKHNFTVNTTYCKSVIFTFLHYE